MPIRVSIVPHATRNVNKCDKIHHLGRMGRSRKSRMEAKKKDNAKAGLVRSAEVLGNSGSEPMYSDDESKSHPTWRRDTVQVPHAT